MAKTMNQAVESRLGNLTATICEYEVITSQLEARVAELEAELAQYSPDHTADEVIADAGNVDDNGWS
jgi:hypothetical protein